MSIDAQSTLDVINRPVWSRLAGLYEGPDGWIDVGERNSIHAVAPEVRDQRILDVGAGAGRTAWLLPLLSDHYVAIDYTPEMIERFHRQHPNNEVLEADARDLSMFEDASFGLVVFSFNGLDAVSHDDRAATLREFRRILKPNGVLVFSTFNKEGPAFEEKPWQVGRIDRHPSAYRAARFLGKLPGNTPRYLRSYQNWLKLQHLGEDHDTWGLSIFGGHDFGVLVHFITPQEQLRELDGLGFQVTSLLGTDGGTIDPAAHNADTVWFYVTAHKPS